MIMTKEERLLKAQGQLLRIIRLIEQAVENGRRIDEAERDVFTKLMEIGKTMLEEFVAAHGDGDVGERVERNGRSLRRLKALHTRRYLSIFGELAISRCVYAVREGQKVEYAPVDQQLGLPAGEFSYVLEDWQQRLCVQESYGDAVTSLIDVLGVAPSERAAEQMTQRVAVDAREFQQREAPPKGAAEGELLVATADGKGVPMRRPLTERIHNSHPRRGKGEKANKKQMAYVGAVYSIDRFVRSADDIVDELSRKNCAPQRPQPQYKQVWAEMTSSDHGGILTGREATFVNMAVDCHERDPSRHKTLICLMDGERALWDMAAEWLPRAIGILDLFHVLERLWQAAYCFHSERSPEAAEFVSHHLRLLLQGKVGYVIGNLRRMSTHDRLTGAKRQTLNAIITYYENNRQHMKYDEYLSAGYPIGSGVAEGACRHLVKDRMERTGMRWTVSGAQAMLHLRAIYINGHWNKYQEYHIKAEQTRLYGNTAA
jgi:hypothetical protein